LFLPVSAINVHRLYLFVQQLKLDASAPRQLARTGRYFRKQDFLNEN
jgi:hypothetical protein